VRAEIKVKEMTTGWPSLLPPEGALFRGGGRGSALGLMLGLISVWRPAGKLRLWAQ
jgi:hypothetical protein